MKKQLYIAVVMILLCAAGSKAQMVSIGSTPSFTQPQFSDPLANSSGVIATSLGTSIVGSQLAAMWLFAANPKVALSPYGMPNIRSAASNITFAGGGIAGAFFGNMIAQKKELSPIEGLAASGAMGLGMFVGGELGAAVGGVPVYYKFSFGDISSMKSRAPLYYAAAAGTIGAVAAGMAVLAMISNDRSSISSSSGKVQFDVNPGGIAQYALKQPPPNQTQIASIRYSW